MNDLYLAINGSKMKSLKETIDVITHEHPQQFVDLNDYDLSSKKMIIKKLPKYLYRGERTDKWSETKSTSSRKNLPGHPDFKEINHWITGRHLVGGQLLNPFCICHFLREAIWNIPCIDADYDNAAIDASIAGLLQHYGLDTSFIDLTSDIRVAGFFAAHKGEVGDVGQLFIIPTKSIENRFFDLSTEFGERPRKQSSFVVWAPPALDLKIEQFITSTGSSWLKFQLTNEDKDFFSTPDLLAPQNDKVVKLIVEWYDNHIKGNNKISGGTAEYFGSAINSLT